MTATTVDEETPLLREQQPQKKPTPLPWAQFTILLVLQLAEPLTSQVIYPFLPQVCPLKPHAFEPHTHYTVAHSLSAMSVSPMEMRHEWVTMSALWCVIRAMLRATELLTVDCPAAINILCYPSHDGPALEPSVRPHWSQASHHDRTIWTFLVDVLLRFVQNILGRRTEVSAMDRRMTSCGAHSAQ